MKRHFVTVLVLAVFALSGHAQANKDFYATEGRFSVTLPKGFTDLAYSKTTTATDEIMQYMRKTERGTCLVQVSDFKEKTLQEMSADKVLAKTFETISKSITILHSEQTTHDAYPAITYRGQIKNGGETVHLRGVMVLAKLRFYNYMFSSTDPSQLTKLDVLMYISSFHVQSADKSLVSKEGRFEIAFPSNAPLPVFETKASRADGSI